MREKRKSEGAKTGGMRAQLFSVFRTTFLDALSLLSWSLKRKSPSMCLVRVPTPQVVDHDDQLAHSQFTVLHLQFVVCCSLCGG